MNNVRLMVRKSSMAGYLYRAAAVAVGTAITGAYYMFHKRRAREIADEQMRQDAHRALGIDTINNYNIALCGNAGVGKSSLVNAFRNVKDNDVSLAAPVLAGAEATKMISKYHHPAPGMKHIVFWDIPGAGTLMYTSADEYFMKNHLYAFDYLFMVSADRFMDVDFKIAKTAKRWYVPTAFIRNKFDLCVDSEKRLYPNKSIDEIKSNLKSRILDDFRENLKKAGLANDQAELYLLSATVFNNDKLKLYAMDEQTALNNALELIKKIRN